MSADPSQLNFPAAFCCNCGDTDCTLEIQDTRLSGAGFGGPRTTFQLAIPVCANCLRTTRRHPSGWLTRLLAWAVGSCALFGALWLLNSRVTLPLWMADSLFPIGALISLLVLVLFYRLRRPRPPQTSFYQPVRIRQARLRFGEGAGQVEFLKLAFTNHEYLNVFTTANRDAIQARSLAAVKA